MRRFAGATMQVGGEQMLRVFRSEQARWPIQCALVVALAGLLTSMVDAAPNRGGDCLGCHVFTEVLPPKHPPLAGLTSEQCQMCHSDAVVLQQTHSKLDAAIAAQPCLSCHADTSTLPDKHLPYTAFTSEQCAMCHSANGAVPKAGD